MTHTMYHCGLYYYPPINNVSYCPENTTLYQPSPTTFALGFELYLLSILCAIGFLGNLISIIVLRCDRERRDTLFLLQVLALADAFYLLVVLLRYPVKYALLQSDSLVYLQLVVFPLHQTAQTITIWMMVLVSMDRYIYVCHPLQVNVLSGYKCRRVSSALVFLFGLLYNAPLYFDSCVMTAYDLCAQQKFATRVYSETFNNAHYFNIYKNGFTIALLYVGPLSLLVFLNYRMIGVIKKSVRWVRASIRRHSYGANDRNASFTLIIIILVFIFCETPELLFRIINIIATYSKPMGKIFTSSVTYKFATVSEVFSVINSSVNFFIYCAFSRRFMVSMKGMLFRRSTHPSIITQELVALRDANAHQG